MLFCIVTFNLWLHYNKLLTYLLDNRGISLEHTVRVYHLCNDSVVKVVLYSVVSNRVSVCLFVDIITRLLDVSLLCQFTTWTFRYHLRRFATWTFRYHLTIRYDTIVCI